MKTLLTVLFSVTTLLAFSQDQLEVIDVLNYKIYLEVSDEHDTIVVDEQIVAKLHKQVDSFYLDLRSLNAGKGMVMSKVEIRLTEQKEITYAHRDDKLWIPADKIPVGTEFTLEIRFSGIPETGLIIGENKFGKRTFFGDNWPNRAHHWFACIDHPSDKAKVSFSVTYPKKYDVVATGRLINNGTAADKNIAVYSSEINLPTKVIVVGIAEFAQKTIYHENSGLFPMTAWVYEDDSENGFKDMAVAADVANYFVKMIGAYPFEKLDHVQSTTQYGGMENAGNIFYDENAVTGEETMEGLIAHEVAHQWFGNSASEADWHHIWLSEGFATYFTELYWENKYGTEAMNKRMISDRTRVVEFSKRYAHPVVDTTYETLEHLLNPHSYQKGAWFLHMLRNEVGDSTFWKGIRSYYQTYKFSNATTAEFQASMESESKTDLSLFFNQWLKEAQHPMLEIKTKTKGKKNALCIRQRQNTHVFDFDLEVELKHEDGSSEFKTFAIAKKKNKIRWVSEKEITGFEYDPRVKLLFEILH